MEPSSNNKKIVPGFVELATIGAIDLTHTLNSEIPTWDGDCGFTATTVWDYKDGTAPNLFRVQTIASKCGAGTHIDAPAHCFEGTATIDALLLDTLVTECVMIDVSNEADENYLAMPSVIEAFEKEHGAIKPNTFVIFYTGWSAFWHDKEKYRNGLSFPSIHEDTAKLLLERNIAGIGIDTLSPDAVGKDFPVHRAILGAGKYIVENVANAKELPPTGARIVVAPLKIEGGTESPIRLIALI